jgi:hypothetical protein
MGSAPGNEAGRAEACRAFFASPRLSPLTEVCVVATGRGQASGPLAANYADPLAYFMPFCGSETGWEVTDDHSG